MFPSTASREIHPALLHPQEGPSGHHPPPRSHPASNTPPFLTAEPLTMPVVTGTFLVGPVSDSLVQPCPPPPALFNTEPASSQTRLKDAGMLGAPRGWASPSPGGAPGVAMAAGMEFLPLPVSPPRLPQPIWSSGPHPLCAGEYAWEEMHPWEIQLGIPSNPGSHPPALCFHQLSAEHPLCDSCSAGCQQYHQGQANTAAAVS